MVALYRLIKLAKTSYMLKIAVSVFITAPNIVPPMEDEEDSATGQSQGKC